MNLMFYLNGDFVFSEQLRGSRMDRKGFGSLNDTEQQMKFGIFLKC